MPIKVTIRNPKGLGRVLSIAVGVALATTAYRGSAQTRPASGKDVFRFDTFGNETLLDGHAAPARGDLGRGRPHDRAVGRA